MPKPRQTANQKKALAVKDKVADTAINEHPVTCPNCGAAASGYDLVTVEEVTQIAGIEVPAGDKRAVKHAEDVHTGRMRSVAEVSRKVAKYQKVGDLIGCGSCGKSFKDGKEWTP